MPEIKISLTDSEQSAIETETGLTPEAFFLRVAKEEERKANAKNFQQKFTKYLQATDAERSAIDSEFDKIP